MNTPLFPFLITTLILTTAHGAPPPAGKEGYKDLDLPDFSSMNAPAKSRSKTKVEMNCRTPDGRTLKQGESGYEACLGSAQNDLRNRAGASESSPTGPSTEVNFQFGE